MNHWVRAGVYVRRVWIDSDQSINFSCCFAHQAHWCEPSYKYGTKLIWCDKRCRPPSVPLPSGTTTPTREIHRVNWIACPLSLKYVEFRYESKFRIVNNCNFVDFLLPKAFSDWNWWFSKWYMGLDHIQLCVRPRNLLQINLLLSSALFVLVCTLAKNRI